MKYLNIPTAINTLPVPAPVPDTGAIPGDMLKLAKVLYPDDSCHELRAIEFMLMECGGAVLPRMPDRLPTLARLQVMTATERSFRLMIHIASLALQIEMLKRGYNLSADHSRPVQRQIWNAQRRLRRACLHAELSHLWRHGRWKIGGLMSLIEKQQRHNTAR